MIPAYLYSAFIILLCGLTILIVAFVVIQNRLSQSKYQETQRIKSLLPKSIKSKQWDQYYLRIYPYLNRIPLVRRLMKKVRNRLMTIHADDEMIVRIRAVRITLTVLLGTTLIVLFALWWSTSWPTRLTILITALYIGGFMIDMFIGRIEKQMLRQQSEMILDIRHEYHTTYMVTRSMEQTAERADPLVAKHAKKIADILNSVDPDEELNLYYDVSPNQYMKQLAAISCKIAEEGDSDVHNGEDSIYLAALSDIRKQIHMELTKRQRLDQKLSGLVFIAASPLFLMDPMRAWSESMFPIVSEFYHSSWGLYSQIILYVLFILSFIGLRKVKNVDGNAEAVKEEGLNYWISKLLKYKIIRKLIRRVAPAEHEPSYFKITELIKNTNSNISIDAFYLQKVLIALTVLIVTVSSQIYIQEKVKHNIIYPNQEITVGGNLESGQKMIKEERYRFESMLIGEMISKDIQPEQMAPFILSKLEGKYFLPTDIDRDTYVLQLMSRVTKYQNQYYKWYELVIAILLAVGSYSIPNLVLKIKHQFRKWEMQNEVDGYFTNIMMLSRFPGITVFEIVEWLHRYSFIFKDQFLRCVLDYDAGAWDALERLKDDAHFVPLERLVDRLQEAVERIPVKKAFDDLHIERDFAIEERKDHNEKTINNREVLGVAIGWTPIAATAFLYLAVPFGYLAFDQLGDLTMITSNL